MPKLNPPAVTELLKFIFDKIGQDASDQDLARSADICNAASMGLFSAIRDEDYRNKMLAKLDARMSQCCQTVSAALDAVENGELEVIDNPKKH